MTDYKKDPLRSQARRDVIKVIGDKEIVNKFEIVKITNLSPLTINSILREFRNYKIITCHAGGLYALSGDGQEVYLQLLTDKTYRKKEYNQRIKSIPDNEEPIVHTIYIDEDEPSEDSTD
ncbi:MAG: hypothetical protein ACTSSH_13360 [Candidatus Heimdallarchaeota archaeon]